MMDASRFASFDLETPLDGSRIVCGSTARTVGGVVVGELLDREAALLTARWLLESDRVIVGAFIVFDFGVLVKEDPTFLPLIFKAYEEERVWDIQIAQAAHAIAEGNLYIDPRNGQPLRNAEGKRGRYSLATVVSLVLGRDDAKDRDFWRKRYALLANVPIDEWPADAKQYPVDDAVNTLEAGIVQVLGGGAGVTPGPHRNRDIVAEECEAAWDMYLGGKLRGVRTSRARVDALRASAEAEVAAHAARAKVAGYLKADGKIDRAAVRRAVVRAYGGDVGKCEVCAGGKVLSAKTGKPIICAACSGTALDLSTVPSILTPTGAVSTDREILAESGDDELAALGENEADKVLNTYVPFVEQGVDEPITFNPNVLLASRRASYDGPIQLLPREGPTRECFEARDGYYFLSCDYSALELCTLAQICNWVVGWSVMADTINATGNPGMLHTALGAQMVGMPLDEFAALVRAGDHWAALVRQAMKPANFGFGGGMGSAKLVLSARKKNQGFTRLPSGVIVPGVRFCVMLDGAEQCGVTKVTEWRGREYPPLCESCVTIVEDRIRPAWFKQWPEMRPYFDWVSRRVDLGGDFPFWGTDSVRGGCGFTDGANHSFQYLAAAGSKRALRAVTRECYLDESSPLRGTFPIAYIHDEIFSETPMAGASPAADRMVEVMEREMRELVPDIAVKVEPSLSKFWSKSAKAVRRDGQLVAWEAQ